MINFKYIPSEFLGSLSRSYMPTVMPLVYHLCTIMADLNLIVDNNLLRIYCSEFNKDVSGYESDGGMTPKMTMVLKKFVYDNIISRMTDYVNLLEDVIFKSGKYEWNVVAPAAAKNSISDVILANSVNYAADIIDPIRRLKYTLMENINSGHGRRSGMAGDPDMCSVSEQEVARFIEIIRDKLSDIYDMASDRDRIAKDTSTKIREVADYIMTLYLILTYGMGSFNMQEKLTYLNYSDANKYMNHIKKMSHLQLSSAICIYPGMVLNITPPEDQSRSYVHDESYKFLHVAAQYHVIRESIYKEINRADKTTDTEPARPCSD